MATSKTNTEKFERLTRFTEDITGGFMPGDAVWVIEQPEEIETCPVCEGAAVIQGKLTDGTPCTLECANCDGRGFVDGKYWYVEEKIIERMELWQDLRSPIPRSWIGNVRFYLGDEDTRFSKNAVFKTKEEAKAALVKAIKSGSLVGEILEEANEY